MFVSSSCEPLPSLFKLCLWRPKMPPPPPQMSHVLFVEILHPVDFVNITHVKSKFNCWSIKNHSWTLRGPMLSYTFINSYSQVSDPGPKCPLVWKKREDNENSKNIQATSIGSDQSAHMRRLIWAFAGRTYHVVGNIMLRLICFSWEIRKLFVKHALLASGLWAFKNSFCNERILIIVWEFW